MEITLRTLTPLWTGGSDRTCDRIHETGILGSLRWWMEVLVRGVGGQVKDPTSDERSSFDAEKYKKSKATDERQRLRDAGLCDVSQIFGATGWKHRFRLEVQEVDVSDASIQHRIKANRTYTDKQGNQKTPTWYFPDAKSPNAPKTGTSILKIQSLHPDFKPEIIGGLIQFIADWSALGARPQMGFGVIQVEGDRINTQPLYDWLITAVKNNTSENNTSDLPSLQNIFLAKIQPKESNSSFKEEDTFNLKYDFRQLLRPNAGNSDNLKDLRHFIMGTVEGERIAAKIKISRPYHANGTTVMRVWGWVPTQAEVYKNDWNREKVVDAIYQHLAAKYTLHVWREMNSVRDTVKPDENNAQAFLCSLLRVKDCDDGGQL